ncbi:MAG: tRNA (adenosine(37)-N6)-threonylcarbamoyltransferase complex ATPase subunit type 1 TsaE [Comamonas sp.]|nr:tRNA (adenosine(37)-N6)-threonylcarbamoyltransferase complex ATPase subunit type 1 TsaE [Comamonas sp.]
MTAAHHIPPIVGSATSDERVLTWQDETDTAAFATQLAGLAELRNAYVTLHGDLGAGKTTFVRHLLRSLGVQGRIKSPTYAVVEPHETPDLQVWHFDFYRFDDPREWEDAGFRDIFAAEGLKLAEWPEKAASLTPQADLAIYIEAIDETQRRVILRTDTNRGRRMLQHWPQ